MYDSRSVNRVSRMKLMGDLRRRTIKAMRVMIVGKKLNQTSHALKAHDGEPTHAHKNATHTHVRHR